MKLARERGMFFGRWKNGNVAESATATETGENISAVSVTASTFGTKVPMSGTYVFKYDGTNWKLNSQTVTLSDYGIVITGTAAANDTITVVYVKATDGWEAIGKDNDELTKELNPDTESSKNVLGESTFTHSGYETEIEVDPYYMDPSRAMFEHMLEVAMMEKYAEEDLLGEFAEAFFTQVDESTRTMSGYCYVRDAWFVPQSVGGDTKGLSIPYNINPVGPVVKKNISYSMATNAATITDIT